MGVMNFTLFAGRFTPAANVDVQHIHEIVPEMNASSNNFLSAFVSPLKMNTLTNYTWSKLINQTNIFSLHA